MGNPFSQMKDLYKMQKEAKEMQKKLREKVVEGESKDGLVVVVMNAASEFEDIRIDDSYLNPAKKSDLKEALSEAFKDYQKKLQKEMMKDFDLSKIRDMIGSN